MHELSVALSILDCAAEESARRDGARVTAIFLKLGPLSGIDRRALESAFELAAEQEPQGGPQLVIEEVPLAVFCPTCDDERPVVSLQEFRCSLCGTPTADVVRGRELEVTALEIES